MPSRPGWAGHPLPTTARWHSGGGHGSSSPEVGAGGGSRRLLGAGEGRLLPCPSGRP